MVTNEQPTHVTLRSVGTRGDCWSSRPRLLIETEPKMSVPEYETTRHKRNEATESRATPPAGAQDAYCSRDDCNHELRGTGTVDAIGNPTIDWYCPTHGYCVRPEYRGGA